MTQCTLGAAVTVDEVLKHEEKDCPFCQDNEKPDDTVESCIDQEWDEDQRDGDEYMTKQIGNDPGKLESNMKKAGSPRPTDWQLTHDVFNCRGEKIDLPESHRVKPNPHHLIPGNESLKESPRLCEWIFASEGKISADIGYDVNNAENGIWLPSNNGMRGNPDWKCETVKITYANAAQRGRGCFHDRHIDYSEFVQRILEKIADRMEKQQDTGCPYKTEKSDDKYDPPYALVPRLNGVSARLKGYLLAFNPDGFRPPMYTSRLVHERVKILVDFDNGKAINISCDVHK